MPDYSIIYYQGWNVTTWQSQHRKL